MYTFTKLHDRRIPKVRVGVGVGPMEFQLFPVAHVNDGVRVGSGAKQSGVGDYKRVERQSPDAQDFVQLPSTFQLPGSRKGQYQNVAISCIVV